MSKKYYLCSTKQSRMSQRFTYSIPLLSRPPAESYTFSAKEKDSETGLSYFGSRYYSSDLSVWLSVDPMSDKYPSLSPYTYCADNPVKLVDPDGEEVCDGGDPSSKRLRRFYDYFDKKIRAPLMKMVEDGAGSITYCIQNRLADKRHDNWSFSVTMRSRRLDIRPELRISNCRSRKKIVRKR